ncbi:MAG: flagellar biosynthetic protein FliO [Alphaproteobacteria bacterium]|nr:flagellar biosynthetic protein FliO [Alphaproteobacteria bacterium]
MNLQEITYFLAALLFVLALMGGLALLLKKLGIAGPAMITPAKRRLKVIENMPLDARRRVVLIERDNQQHLILLGQHNDLVIEQNISLDAEDLKNIEHGKERAA